MSEKDERDRTDSNEAGAEDSEGREILEEIEIEDLAVDGICGVY
jgi:mycofactocin precursor